MSTVPQIGEALQGVLNDFAEAAARRTGFVQRASKLSGASFAQSLVFGWLGKPDCSLSGLTQTAAAVGVKISNQGLDERFNERAAIFMEEVLFETVAQVIGADPVAVPLLERFGAIFVQDSSTIVLPNELSKVWRGNGSRTGHGKAALKIQVRLNLTNGELLGPLLEDGRNQDKGSAIQDEPIPSEALGIADLGFFSLNNLKRIEGEGGFYLTKLQVQTAVFDEEGKQLDLLALLRKAGSRVDIPIQLGKRHRLKARLLAIPVPPKVVNERRRRMRRAAKVRGQTVSKRVMALAGWTILTTDAPMEKLSLEDALVLARARWQIELLFKLWKQHGRVDEWRSSNPWRIMCEVYAKLIAVVIQHWLILTSLWQYPDRSLVKAAQTVRNFAMMLASAMAGIMPLNLVIEQINRCLEWGCRMNPRRTKPNTYQLLLELADAS